MAANEITPIAAPKLSLPVGSIICQVSAVNTTCDLTSPINTLCEPSIEGHELFSLPTIAFLITHPTGRQILFDLGCRKDFWNLPKPITDIINEKVPGIRVKKNLVDILTEGGIDPVNLEAAIISHHHYDHTGDPSTFPKSMDLIVGPGFSKEFLPGYPAVQTAPLHEGSLDGRNVHELDFVDCPEVAGFPAVDYFKDRSLYILNSPGHALGHISALVRTSESTFIFLGGDICHFGGSFRPTPFNPMPSLLSSSEVGRGSNTSASICCTQFTACHPNQQSARTSPYYKVCTSSDSWYMNPLVAQCSIDKLKAIDADSQVLALIAHDPGTLEVIPFFPSGTINDWQKCGWKHQLRWQFLDELSVDGKERRKLLVDGTYIEGNRVKDLAGNRVQ
ncbi:beta-lactamase-like protein [Dendryphion nanum]|uniref:Beta-lactamase-like protein n=1 Tax=Dendryphion nanum TaxID=256645 RepID=A0A9P9CZW1_9PLEO|nr:beta-lactamase-like protein [Dendryphion nanum]